MAKKYFWLKLKDDFFQQPRIKKLRRIAGGDTYTLIYLKMQLLSLKNNGVLMFEGIEEDFAEEVALTIDEETDNVRFTIMYLINQGLMQEVQENEFALLETMQSIGSETAGAARVRKHREQQKALQSNGAVTNSNTEIEIDIEKDIDTEKEKEKKNKGKAARFTPPTLEEVQAYISENNFSVDAARFVDYYAANGWQVGKSKMKDWRATVRNWNRREKESKPQQSKQQKSVDFWDADSLPF